MENVELPSTLKRIEYNAFDGCSKLSTVRLPEGLEYIGKSCFSRSAISSIDFPSSLKTIAQGVFASCENLRTVVLNDTLETLGTDEYQDKNGMLPGVF